MSNFYAYMYPYPPHMYTYASFPPPPPPNTYQFPPQRVLAKSLPKSAFEQSHSGAAAAAASPGTAITKKAKKSKSKKANTTSKSKNGKPKPKKANTTSKSKNGKPKPKKADYYSQADVESHRKARWKGWEINIREILTEMKFEGESDEVVPEILARAERHFAAVGGRLRKEAMRRKHVLPCVETWKAKNEEEKGKGGKNKKGGDYLPCEGGIDNHGMCVGGLQDDDDDCLHGGDDDDDVGCSLDAAPTPANYSLKAVDATTNESNDYNRPIPKKKRFDSTRDTGVRLSVPEAAADTDSSDLVPAPSIPAPPPIRKTVVLKAKQGLRLQIVPDQKKGDKDFSKRTLEQRRDAWVKAIDGRTWNGNNKAQKARGLYYSGEAVRNNRDVLKIDPRKFGEAGKDVEICVSDSVEGREDHFVRIHYLSEKERVEFGEKANDFASKWNKNGFVTSSRTCIQGGMVKCGFSKGAGHHPHFFMGGTWDDLYSKVAKSGFAKGITDSHKALNRLGRIVVQKYFRRAFESIQKTNEWQKMKVPSAIGGDDGLCMNIIQSGSGMRNEGGPIKGQNFTTESHVDSRDLSEYCSSIWTSSDSSDPAGWYFVLPFLSCVHKGKKYEGIAIRLRHGVGIEWAGRCLFHCSTAPDTDRIDVNGTFYGVPGATIE